MIEEHWIKITKDTAIPRDKPVLLGRYQNGMWLFNSTYVTPNATVQALLAEGHTHVAALPAWIAEGP